LALAVPAWPASAASSRIVAVGDLHGDFAAWRAIARAARLVDETGRWIGGNTVLVQTGDVVDRGPDSLKLIQDFMRLQREAPRAGGQVVALIGNHEAMNMTGDLRYVSAGDYAALTDGQSAERRERAYAANKAAIMAAYRQSDAKMTDEQIKQAWFAATPLGAVEHRIAWDPAGAIGGWVLRNPAVAVLDGNLFVHGGISPAYAHMSAAEINNRVRAALAARMTDVAAIINDPVGPLWYRGLATPHTDAPATKPPGAEEGDGTAPPEPPVEDQLNVLLPAFGAKRIIIGHTPILSGIAMLHDGRLIRIDTGISSAYGGALSYLDIIDGTPVPHSIARTISK
jgi:hypothetical protein